MKAILITWFVFISMGTSACTSYITTQRILASAQTTGTGDNGLLLRSA
jgi:hypothetical protein